MTSRPNDQSTTDYRTLNSRGTRDAAARLTTVVGCAWIAIGFCQLLVPAQVLLFTAFEEGNAATMIGMLWTSFGALMTFGGIAGLRALAINTSLSMLIVSASGVVAALLAGSSSISLMMHGLMAIFTLICSVISYIMDRSDLRRELRLLQSTSKDNLQSHAE